jgi:hypothetical protein
VFLLVPIYAEGQRVGFLSQKRQGLYTQFYGEVTTDTVVRVFAVFAGGECSLGVPVPEQGKMVLRASMPTSRLPSGQLREGRLLPMYSEPWEPFQGGTVGQTKYPAGWRQKDRLRFLWAPGQPLPADEMLLFYRFVKEGNKTYLELRLHPNGSPILEESQPEK